MVYQQQTAQDELTSQPEAYEHYSATCSFEIFSKY